MIWKVYTVCFGILAFMGYYQQGMPRIWELVDFLLFLPTFFGLVSYVWGQPLFSRVFWKLFFPVIVVWNAAYLFWVPDYNPQGMSHSTEMLLAGLSAVILLPNLVALYRYAYKSAHMWSR